MTTHVTIIDIVLFVVIGLLLIVLAERSAKAKKLYAQLTKEFESQQETLGMAIDSLHKVKSDRQKLFDIAKGATDKLAEMNVALEGLEVKEEKDWSKEAFPDGYIIPLDTHVIALNDGGYAYPLTLKGKTGIVVSNYIKHGASVKFKDEYKPWFMNTFELAPLNPIDHPNHPNFRG